MPERIIPLTAKLSLIVGVILIWAWEACLAALGYRGWSWCIIAAAAALIVAAYLILLRNERP